MENLSLGNINWSFENLSLQISKCSFAAANLTVCENLSNENYSNAFEGINIFIADSTLGYLRAYNVSQIRIRNSNITGRDADRNSSFLILQNSNIVISDSTFTNNSIQFNSARPTLLTASINSNISFVNCTLSGNTGYVSIIQVTKLSSLNLINSVISYNKILNGSTQRTIFFANETCFSAVNCTFIHNQLVSPKSGGAVVKITYFPRIYLDSCIITNNQGISLLVEHRVDGGKVNITNSYIAENYSPYEISSTFSLQAVSGGAFYVLNCTFLKNYATNGGAVWGGEAYLFHFKDCIFKENKASTGGAAEVGGQVYFENCEFYANEGILQTGAIMDMTAGSLLVIDNCVFRDNRGITSAGALSIVFGAALKVLRSTFINNTSEDRAGAILLERNGNANISDSIFINNSAVRHGCIETNTNVSLQIYRTHFKNNKAQDVLVFADGNVIIQILLSKFEHNTAKYCIKVRQNSSLIVSNSEFSENDISPGSVIFVDLNSKFTARNSTFLNHSKALYGAVIYGSQNSNIDLTESTLHYNQGTFGGAIYIANCTLKIADASFGYNNATDGGVICAMFSNVHIHNSSCINNTVKGYGGCLYAASSNLSVANSDMSFNQAFSGGAVMICPNSDFSAIETKFYNNKAVATGGAIYRRQSGHMALDQCTFGNNHVNDSYGIYGSDIAAIEVHDLRLSQCNFQHKATDPTASHQHHSMGHFDHFFFF